jgi:hypothetical protein
MVSTLTYSGGYRKLILSTIVFENIRNKEVASTHSYSADYRKLIHRTMVFKNIRNKEVASTHSYSADYGKLSQITRVFENIVGIKKWPPRTPILQTTENYSKHNSIRKYEE